MSLALATPIVVAPGVYDPLTALLATQAGFASLYVSGAAIAYTRLGRPDIGLVSVSEVIETVSLIHDRVDADLIVDADNGRIIDELCRRKVEVIPLPFDGPIATGGGLRCAHHPLLRASVLA